MKKRKWIYVSKPQSFDIKCDKCNGINIDWSEFEHKIWCYDCKIDTCGTVGIFDGPIPINIGNLLGFTFNRLYLKSKKIMKPVESKNHKIIYRQCEKPLDKIK